MNITNLSLDFGQTLKYVKGITARQGDKGATIAVVPYTNGVKMNPSEGFFTLHATTPSGANIEIKSTHYSDDTVYFDIDGKLLKEVGEYSNVYVSFKDATRLLSTQDVRLVVSKVSDLNDDQYDEYVSRLEELINQYNERFDAFMEEIKGDMTALENRMNAFETKGNDLQKQLDQIQADMSKLTIQKYKLTKDDGTAFKLSDLSYKPVSFQHLRITRGYIMILIAEAQPFTDYAKVPAELKTANTTGFILNNVSDVDTNSCIQILYNTTIAGAINRVAIRRVTASSNPDFTLLSVTSDITSKINSAKTEVNTYTDTKVKALSDDTTSKLTAVGTRINAVEEDVTQLNEQINQVYQIGEEVELPLASGFTGADGTTPKYRVDVINGRRKIQFMGAVSKSDSTLPSVSSQHAIVTGFDADLCPKETKMGLGATGEFVIPSRIAMTSAGTLYVGNNSGKDVKYAYLDLFTYWLD